MSTSVHVENNIADFVRACIHRILGKSGSIFDVTCGKYNRQFKKYLSSEFCYDGVYHYKATDLLYGFDVFNKRAPEPDYDLVWYDPPFTPRPKKEIDQRYDNYGTEEITIDMIKHYFSKIPIGNLLTFTKKYLVVRGMDFYYPINSFQFYSFYDIAIKRILEENPVNLYCNYIMPYTRKDLDTLIQINKRPVINYSYTAVFMKGSFE